MSKKTYLETPDEFVSVLKAYLIEKDGEELKLLDEGDIFYLTIEEAVAGAIVDEKIDIMANADIVPDTIMIRERQLVVLKLTIPSSEIGRDYLLNEDGSVTIAIKDFTHKISLSNYRIKSLDCIYDDKKGKVTIKDLDLEKIDD